MRVEYKFLDFYGEKAVFNTEDFPLGKDIPMRIESVKAEADDFLNEQTITITFRIMQK